MESIPTLQEGELTTHNFTVAARIKPSSSADDDFKVVFNKNNKEMYIETRNNTKSLYYAQKSKNFKMNHIFPESTSN